MPAGAFYRAEEYHQDYYKKQSAHYKKYRELSGRGPFLEKMWKNDQSSTEALRKKLTPLAYSVTQNEATEPPFQNAYWDNKKEGIYVDAVSGEVLFSSQDKFDSGTGWPSFTKPVDPAHIVQRQDRSLAAARTEVRSRNGNSHLGHVFNDGPAPTGLRYCINSAALRFIPKGHLEKEGYGSYRHLFEKGGE